MRSLFRTCLFVTLSACTGQISTDPNGGTDPAEKDAIPSDSPIVHVESVTGVSDCYGVGDTVGILVNYSAPVVVLGNPAIVLNALANNGKNIVAIYDKENSSSTQLRFTYTVNEGDSADASGYPAALTYSNENALQLNGASIRDENGNTVSLKLLSPPASISNMLIDGIRPRIESVSSSDKNLGTTIFTRAEMPVYVDVAYSEIVDFDTSPTLALNGSRQAVSDSSGGSSMLRFAYRVRPLDSAHSLLLEDESPIIGDVYDTCGNVANSIMDERVCSAALRNPALIVETVQPVLETLTASLPSGTYGIDTAMTLTATFSKSVILSSDATLKLLLNSGARLTSAPGAPTIGQSFVFSYVVAAPQTTGANDLAVMDLSLSPGGKLRDAAVPIVDADLSAIPSISTALKIDGIVPTVTSVSASGLYGFGQTIPINIKFLEPVRVMGDGASPILNLTFNITASNANATYLSGDGTSELTFNYVVGPNVAADPLACSSTTALLVPGKKIVDRAGNAADLNLPNPLTLGATFDTRPLVTNVFNVTPNQAYRYNDTLQVGITFAAPVNVTGIPQLKLTLNTSKTTPVANYVSSSNSSTLIFSYTVQSGDAATVPAYNGTAALSLNGGTIKDGSDANAVLTLPGGNPLTGSIDALPVTVASVSASGNYGLGQTVPISVKFAKEVTVAGIPQLALTLTTSRTQGAAHFTSKSDASTLVFNYVVQALDQSPLEVLALSLNGGTIVDPNNNNNPANLTLTGKNISAVIEARPLIASSVSTSFTSGTYGTLQSPLPITINFNRNVKATAAGNLVLTADVNNRSVSYAATNSFANTLALSYPISSSDDKMAFNPSSLSTAWVDEFGNSLLNPTNFSVWAGMKTIVLDGKAPIITAVSAFPAGTVGIGKPIAVTLTYSEPVSSGNGNVSLTLNVGGVSKTVTSTVTNSSHVVFNYTIAAGDMGDIVIANANALTLGANVTLGDYDGTQTRRLNDAILSIPAEISLALGVTANTAPLPAVVSVTASGSYGSNKAVPISVQFSKKIAVTGTPQLALTLETSKNAGNANFVSTSNDSTMVFNYTVQFGDQAAPLKVLSLSLNGGSIVDPNAYNNPANLTLNGKEISAVVEASLLEAISVSTSLASGTYGSLQKQLPITINFNRNVKATAAGSLTLTAGANTRTVSYSATNSFANTLTLNYTIRPSDHNKAFKPSGLSTDWVDEFANSLKSPTTFTAWEENKKIVLDIKAPSITAVSASPSGTFGIDRVIDVTLTFSEPVSSKNDLNLPGNLSLALKVGGVSKTVTSTVTNSSQLVFNYTIAAGDMGDIVIANANALTLGANVTLGDYDGTRRLNDADLSIPAEISLALGVTANTAPLPVVTSVTASGSYGYNQTVPIAVQFSKTIAVTGTPQLALTLTTSQSARTAHFVSTSNSSTMVFNYTVETADQGNPLDALSLSLNGGSIVDPNAFNNPADLTLRGKSISAVIEASSLMASSVSTSFASGTYGTLQSPLPITINFNRNVKATAAGSLTLTAGVKNRSVSYVATNSFANTLALSYPISSSDDKMAFNPSSLSTAWVDEFGNSLLNPTTFTDWVGQKTIVLDGKAPVITAVSASPSGTFRSGQAIAVTLTYSEPVSSGNGNLSLTLNVGGVSKTVTSTVTNSLQVVFNYTIAAGDMGDIVIANANALTLGANVTLGDYDATQTRRLNNAQLSIPAEIPLALGVTANTAPLPEVTSVTASGNYGYNQTVPISVQFSKIIAVTGTPQLALTLNTSQSKRTANFVSTSNSSTLVFNYIVDTADQGNPLDALTLSLNGGSIVDPNAYNNPANLTLNGKSISAVIEASSLMASSVSSTFASGTYGTLQNPLPITINFNRNVKATAAGSLTLTAGVNNRTVSFDATNSFAKTLALKYTISSSDDRMAFNPFRLSATGVDEFGNNLLNPTTFTDWVEQKTIVLDGKAPVITTVSASPSGTFRSGQSIAVTLTYSEPVSSGNGNLSLTLNVGGVSKTVTSTVTNSSQVVFNYTIAAGDMGDIVIANANALTLGPNVTLGDYDASQTRRLNDAILSIPVLALGVTANTAPLPEVTSVTASGNYGYHKTVPISVQFSKTIAVTGTPQLALTLKTSQSARTANFVSTSSSSTMVFNYTVENADQGNPLEVLSLSLNGGSIVDPNAYNNPADLTLRGKNISAVIEASTLMASSVSTSLASGTYGTLQSSLPITINFNRNVKVTAAGSLTLTSGVNKRSVSIAATNSFANTLALSYPISSSDDGMTINPFRLIATGEDVFGNNLMSPKDFSGWDGGKTIVLDCNAPTITGVSASPPGTYVIGDVITVTLTFSEPVSSRNGNLLLVLSVGGVSKTLTSTVTKSTQVVFSYTIVAGDMGAITIAGANALTLGAGVTLGDYDASQTRRLNDANLSLSGFTISGVVANTRPQAPTSLTAYSQATADPTAGSVNLAWTAPAVDRNRSGFAIWYSTTVDLTGVNPTDGNAPSSPPAGITAVATADVRSIIGGLAARAPFRFKVWAYNPAFLYSAGTNVVYETPRNWNYNAYLKAINSGALDYLGGGLSANGSDEKGGRGVDIASWQYPTDTWMFAVAAAPWSELELTGVENSDNSYKSGDKDGSSNAGAVYVYKRNAAPGNDWTHDAILHPHCQKSADRLFGFSVAMSNKTIVVGEPRSNIKTDWGDAIVNGSNALDDGCTGWNSTDGNRGGVFIYEQQASNGSEANWAQTAFIRSAVFGADDSDFGWSVALSGNTLVVGATNAYGNDGAALMYTRSGGNWGSEFQFVEPTTSSTAADRFGFSVAVDESTATAVVGAPWEDGACGSHSTAGTGCVNDSNADSGAVFVYATNNSSSKNYLKASNAGASDLFGFSVAISSDTLVVGAPKEDSGVTTITLGSNYSGGNDSGQDDRGAVYVFKRSGSNWIQEAVLKAPLNKRAVDNHPNIDGFDQFGWSVDISGDMIVVGALYEDRYPGFIFNGAATNSRSDAWLKNTGAAYVFRRTGTSWYSDGYLKPLRGISNAYEIAFGAAVAIDPATQAVIVAAPQDNYERTDTVYSWNATVGTTEMYFRAGESPAPFNRDMNEDDDDSGAVYIFTP